MVKKKIVFIADSSLAIPKHSIKEQQPDFIVMVKVISSFIRDITD